MIDQVSFLFLLVFVTVAGVVEALTGVSSFWLAFGVDVVVGGTGFLVGVKVSEWTER